MHVQHHSLARRCRGRIRLLLPAASLCLAMAACSGAADTVMAPPSSNTTLAMPTADTTAGFCNSLPPAQRAADPLCGAPARQ